MNISGKNITIIGGMRSGIGAAKLVKRLGGNPFVSDSSSEEKLLDSIKVFKENEIDFEARGHSDKVYDCDVMIVSPGVPSDAPVIIEAKKRNIRVISEIELAASVCKGKIIAITGTNGKTTTTTLCGHVFNTCGMKAYTAGNIGYAFSEIALDVKESEFVALEVSSFQLDMVESFKPYIAMILNITPDHLNRYGNSFANYASSKLRIYMNQDKNDFLILNADNEALTNVLTERKSRNFYFSLNEIQNDGCYLSGSDIIYNHDSELQFSVPVSEINLKGEHNYANAMAVIIAAKNAGCDNEKIKEALKSFKGVEHRLELVREIDGVTFINDSKATNVDSVWYALRSFDNPLFLILGGQDKGNDYSSIREMVREKVKKIYAIGSSADKVFNFFHADVKVEIKKSLEDVVSTASNEAREGDVVLLSPACASFDMFDNYEHRGRVFKEAVAKL